MKTLNDIKTKLNENRSQLFLKFPIKSIAIFGSYAREEQLEISDIDILVEFNDRIGIRFIDLAEELEDLLQIKVDLVSKKGIKKKYYSLIEPDLIYV